MLDPRLNNESDISSSIRTLAFSKRHGTDARAVAVLEWMVAVFPSHDQGSGRTAKDYLGFVDKLGLYGRDISSLFDVCGGDPRRLMGLLLAHHRGLANSLDILDAARSMEVLKVHALNVDDIIRAVQTTEPGFQRIVPNLARDPKGSVDQTPRLAR